MLWLLYLLSCLVSWYVVMGVSYSLSGGQLGRHPFFFPLQCFAEEIKFYWFGGQKHRIAFIKDRCAEGEGAFGGYTRNYTYEEVREKGIYEEVFWEMMPSRMVFLNSNILSFFAGPLLLLVVLVAWLLCRLF